MTRRPLALLALALAACAPVGSDDDDDDVAAGTVSFTIEGVTYSSDVVGANRRAEAGSLIVSFQDDPARGDLGAIRGSISLAAGYVGPGSYGPLDRSTDYGCNVTIRHDDGSETGWQGPPLGTPGDGAIEIDSDDGLHVEGSLSFTAVLWDDPDTSTGVIGSFAVDAPEQQD